MNDPGCARKLTPGYTLGCKRTLVSSDYYPAFNQPGVELETGGIAEIREHSIVTKDGREIEADAIIFGTGFHVIDAMARIHLVGRDGLKLSDAWRDGITAHLGTTVAGFPNLFLLVGPNTGLGHNSIIFMIEAQVRYIMSCLRLVARSRARAIEVRPRAQQRFNDWVQEKSSGSVWLQGGCASWYLDSEGVNRALWPASTVSFWLRMRRARRADFQLEGSRGMTALADARTAVIRCRDGDHTIALTDRELTAERLIGTSRRHSFDPDVDVDWDAPPAAGLFYAPPELVSLYETPLWDRLTDEQRDRADQARDREPGIVRHLVGAAADADPRAALLPEPLRQQPRRLRADRDRRRVPALRHVRPDGADAAGCGPIGRGPLEFHAAQGARRDLRPDADVRRGARDRGVHRFASSASPSPTSGSSRWSAR